MSVEPVIKLCGITTADDLRAAQWAGASHVGFVFAPASRRRVDDGRREAMDAARSFHVKHVGVFQGQAREEVAEIQRTWSLDVVQLHGGFSTEDALWLQETTNVPIWWASRVVLEGNHAVAEPAPDCAAYVLLDTAVAQQFGGTGVVLPWERLQRPERPFVVAGGLSPQNVRDAIVGCWPSGVDVSGGVERDGHAPHKDPQKMLEFVRNARLAWQETAE